MAATVVYLTGRVKEAEPAAAAAATGAGLGHKKTQCIRANTC
jgi:hypothetical protein